MARTAEHFPLKFCESEPLRDLLLGKTGSQCFSSPGPWTGSKNGYHHIFCVLGDKKRTRVKFATKLRSVNAQQDFLPPQKMAN